MSKRARTRNSSPDKMKRKGLSKKAQANLIKLAESGYRGPFSLTTGKKINLGSAPAYNSTKPNNSGF